MKKLMLLILSMVFLPSLSFAEDIDGAFGFKFGEVLDKSLLIDEKCILYDWHPDLKRPGFQCFVVPKKAVSFFIEYVVWTTPISNKIYLIAARGVNSQTIHSKNEFIQIMKLLQAKYNNEGTYLQLDDIYSFTMSQSYSINGKEYLREIRLTRDLVILYEDTFLLELAEKERLKIESDVHNAEEGL